MCSLPRSCTCPQTELVCRRRRQNSNEQSQSTVDDLRNLKDDIWWSRYYDIGSGSISQGKSVIFSRTCVWSSLRVVLSAALFTETYIQHWAWLLVACEMSSTSSLAGEGNQHIRQQSSTLRVFLMPWCDWEVPIMSIRVVVRFRADRVVILW